MQLLRKLNPSDLLSRNSTYKRLPPLAPPIPRAPGRGLLPPTAGCSLLPSSGLQSFLKEPSMSQRSRSWEGPKTPPLLAAISSAVEIQPESKRRNAPARHHPKHCTWTHYARKRRLPHAPAPEKAKGISPKSGFVGVFSLTHHGPGNPGGGGYLWGRYCPYFPSPSYS